MDEQSYEQLFYLPEYAYKTDMPLTKKGSLEVILKIVVAFSNTSGGILLVGNTSKESMKFLDQWRGKLVDQFAKVIKSNVIMPHIEIDPDLKVIYILVASTSALVTYDYHMHHRIFATTQKVTNDEKCATIIKQEIVHIDGVKLADLPHGHLFPRLETRNLEFKNIPKSEALANRIRTSQDRIQKCLLAFPNTPGGGDLIFGLEEQEHQYRVEGNHLTEENKRLICTAVDEVFTGGQESPRIWGDSNSKSPEPKLWSVNFVRLLDQPRYLTHISVEQFGGGFFSRTPECYFVSEMGAITNLGFGEWKSQLLKIDPEEIKSPEGMGDAERPPVPAAGIHVHEPHQKVDGAEFKKENHVLNELAINKKLEKKQSVSYKEASTFWTNADTDGDIPTSTKRLTFTNKTNDVKDKSYIPPTESVLHNICAEIKENHRSAQLKEMVEIALQTIEQEIAEVFVGFPQRYWIESLIPDDSKHFRLNNVVMDLVILTERGRILFWSIISEIKSPGDEDNCRMYALLVCRLLKKRMLQSLSALNTPEKVREVKSTIKPYLYNMEKHQIMNILNCIPDLLLQSMEGFFGPCDVPTQELQAAICTLLHDSSFHIRDRIGGQISITLTQNQMQDIIDFDKSRFCCVIGPPGSGKTVMALYLANHYSKKNGKVYYICTSTVFENYIKFQNIKGETRLILDHAMMADFIESIPSDAACFILDDVHNLDLAKQLWHQFYQAVLSQTHAQLFIFTDPSFQNYHGDQATRTLRESFDEFCLQEGVSKLHKELTDVYRNSQVVCSFIKANATHSGRMSEQGDRIIARSPLRGDDAIVQEMKNADSEDNDNGLLEVLDDTIGHQNDSQFFYEVRDVTVLADTETRCEFFRKLLRRHRPDLQVQSADELPVNGVVLDTADNFWGLETKVCYYIASKPAKDGSAKCGIHNEKFVLFLASRAVYKVVFLLPYPVTSDMARRLQMDDFTVLLQGETEVDDFKNMTLDPERIKIEDNILSNGCYGPLYKARFENEDGEWHNLLAKSVEGRNSSETAALTQECLNQVEVTQRLQDLNIMSIYGLTRKSGTLYVLETNMREGSLLNYCRKRGQGLQRTRMVMLLGDVLNGMAYLAEQKVIHKNLCARKCLVDGELRVKVSGFGRSRAVTGVAWRAPETWEIGAAAEPPDTTTASDVWSYGTLMWEVMSRGEVPFDGESEDSVHDKILKGMRLTKPAAATDTDYDMMMKCWMEEPHQRPHFNTMLRYIDEEVLQSPYQSLAQYARV